MSASIARASSRLPCFASSRARAGGRAQFPRLRFLKACYFDRGEEGLLGLCGTRDVLHHQQFAFHPMRLRLTDSVAVSRDERERRVDHAKTFIEASETAQSTGAIHWPAVPHPRDTALEIAGHRIRRAQAIVTQVAKEGVPDLVR